MKNEDLTAGSRIISEVTAARIDLSKKYKTKDGREVRIALIDNGRVHGFINTPAPESLAGDFVGGYNPWIPFMWKEESGEVFHESSAVFNRDHRLIEDKPTKQVSVTIFVSENGRCYLEENIAKNAPLFGAFTVNLEIEKGSLSKIYNLNNL